VNKLTKSASGTAAVLLLPIALELDEQWSFVGRKSNQRWLWLAINHYTSEILAYTFGNRTDTVLRQLKYLLSPFNITKYFTDGLGAYQRLLPQEQHEEGKRNTQKIERKFLTFRTRIKRLARKTICFSKSEWMHDIVIGLFINRFEFGRKV
jgi:insertion element IS1 protein InsB